MAKPKPMQDGEQPATQVAVVLRHHVHHDGEHYKPGQRIVLDENAAQALLAVHAVKLAPVEVRHDSEEA